MVGRIDLANRYQPYDSDLAAIAALSTTSYGRAFLEFANEAAFKAGVNLEIGTDVQAYHAKTARVATGVYTGDGATSQAITGVGFAPKVVFITIRTASGGAGNAVIWTSDVIIDDNASGGAVVTASSGATTFEINAIIALGADGFTVDDAGSDSRPNANGVVYNYWAIG